MVLATIQADVVLERLELTVDAGLGEAARTQVLELLLELALAAPHDRREHVDALVLRIGHHEVDDPLERLARDGAATVRAMGHADVREEQAQVVVNLGDRAHRRTRIAGGRLLLDGNRRRQPFDQVDVGLFHLLEELAGVGRQRLDVPSLALGVERIEGQRRLARPGEPGDHHQTLPGQIDVDVPQVVNARAADGNPVVRHRVIGAAGPCGPSGATVRPPADLPNLGLYHRHQARLRREIMAALKCGPTAAPRTAVGPDFSRASP